MRARIRALPYLDVRILLAEDNELKPGRLQASRCPDFGVETDRAQDGQACRKVPSVPEGILDAY